jgi:hypothetical protein
LHTLTVHDIPVDSVRTWFREKELWLERSTGEMFGPLQVAYEQAPQEAKDGLDYLYDAVFKKSATFLRTTEPAWAQKAYSLVQLILQLSPGSSGLVDSFYALDGGRPYKDLTVEQFAAQQTAAEAVAERQTIIDDCLNPIAAAHAAASAKLNNAQAALGPEHTDGLTLEQLQARCNAITASETGEP